MYNTLKFLDDQATKEKEYKIADEYINKRNYLDFMNKKKNFWKIFLIILHLNIIFIIL